MMIADKLFNIEFSEQPASAKLKAINYFYHKY